ncbi:MAG: ribonuclease H family protein [Prevotellaceae bacterium]|jgi:ribonuclease HI|nr:ribonuclease H family protein [Prevotellaceae bacterium]
MAKRKQKFYVVWRGVTPGVYDNWEECKQQVLGFPGARYKSFDTLDEANKAFSTPPKGVAVTADTAKGAAKPAAAKKETAKKETAKKAAVKKKRAVPAEAIGSMAVDAACSGNPGPMEYRGVHTDTGEELFHFGPVYGTNNIGEYLAIVHALALLKQQGKEGMTIFSDSAIAIGWVNIKRCKTMLPREAQTERLFQLIDRATTWLRDNEYTTQVKKWNTRKWGEIPADFGRK